MSEWEIKIDGFLRAFEEQFEEEDAGSLKPDTQFRELEEWSSMQALMVIVSWDDEYGVTISAEELESASTIGDLYQLVASKVVKA